MREASLEIEQSLPRIAITAVLFLPVCDALTGELVLELHSEDGQAIQEEHHINAVLVLPAVLELAGDAEYVCRKEPLCFLVHAGCRLEVREHEITAVVLHPAPQDIQHAAHSDLLIKTLQEFFTYKVLSVVFRELLPFLRLCRLQEFEKQRNIHTVLLVVVHGRAPAVRTFLLINEIFLDVLFEAGFAEVCWHKN